MKNVRVLTTTLRDVVPINTHVALKTNGQSIRVSNCRTLCQLIEIEFPQIQFHQDDASFEMQIDGMTFIGGTYHRVCLTLG